MVRNQQRQVKWDMEGHRMHAEKRTRIERTPDIHMFLFTGKEFQFECGRGRETVHFNADSSSPELLARTTVAVNQFTI